MKCNICGGILKYSNGIYTCENCDSNQSFSAFYEKTSVFIAYIENNESGRRTKDSIIAQGIYNRLENIQINTFYERISTSELTDKDYLTASQLAFDSADIVILFGTNKEYFNLLLEKYGNSFNNKKILPVYSDMEAYDLPADLNSLQALNYNTIGAEVSLIKNILKITGKENEYNFNKLTSASTNKKKLISLSVITAGIAVILIVSLYLIFGTPYVLKSKKYNYAVNLIKNNNYIKAIDVLSGLGDYNNSSDLLKNIYNKYDGYYCNADYTVNFYFNIIDNLRAEIEITKKFNDGKRTTAYTTAAISNDTIEFAFEDSRKNKGSGQIALMNDIIKLNTYMENDNANLSIGNLEEIFSIQNKSDAPAIEKIDINILANWLENKTTRSQLADLGYELELDYKVYPFSGVYNITGSNSGVYLTQMSTDEEEPVVSGIYSNASTLIPDKIGHSSYPFVENDIVYFPYGKFYPGQGSALLRYDEIYEEKISASTKVLAVSKTVWEEGRWSELLYNIPYAIEENDIGEQTYFKELLAENTTHYLIWGESHENNNSTLQLYRMNKKNFKIEFIDEVAFHYDKNYYEQLVFWQTLPGLAEEFPETY